MATFNKEDFRRQARIRALKEKARRNPSTKRASATSRVGARNLEEQKVLEAYRRYTEGKRKAKPSTRRVSEARKAERIARIKEKNMRRIRIARIKEKIAAERNGASLKESAAKNPRLGRRPTSLREGRMATTDVQKRAKLLKEKVRVLRRELRENDMMAMDPGVPMANQTGLEPNETGADMNDPYAVNDPNAATPLPPEISAQIQNIVDEVNDLAASAGLETTGVPGVDPMAGETDSNIPDITDEVGAAPADPNAPVMTESRKKAILSAIKERNASKPRSRADHMINETQNRIARRREALAKLRAASLRESGDGGESVGNAVDYYNKNLKNAATQQYAGPTVGASAKATAGGKPLAGPGGKMPASIKPAKTWPTRPYKGKKTFENSKVNPEEDDVEEMEEKNAAWDAKFVDRVLEKKELNFKALLNEGYLG